jgi:hypothetical protein
MNRFEVQEVHDDVINKKPGRGEDLYSAGQKKYTRQGRINYDRIFRGGDGETEIEDLVD